MDLFVRREALKGHIARARRAKREARELFQKIAKICIRGGKKGGSLYEREYGSDSRYYRALSELERIGWGR